MIHVLIYSRQGCHLCDDALRILRQELQSFEHSLETRDVDSNPEWQANYTDCVPVIVINGKERFRGIVNQVLLRRLLKAEGK